MKVSTLLCHVQRAAGIRNPDLLSLLASADIHINSNTLAAWRSGEREPGEVRQIVIRDLCAKLHTCERCEGDPLELRPAPELVKPVLRQRLGVSRSDPRYHRRDAQLRSLLKRGETSVAVEADADAVAAEAGFLGFTAGVKAFGERWRITMSEETQIDAAIERLAAGDANQ